MKTYQSRLLVIAALGWATIGFWATPVSAQTARTMAQGHFTLPYDVHWPAACGGVHVSSARDTFMDSRGIAGAAWRGANRGAGD